MEANVLNFSYEMASPSYDKDFVVYCVFFGELNKQLIFAVPCFRLVLWMLPLPWYTLKRYDIQQKYRE